MSFGGGRDAIPSLVPRYRLAGAHVRRHGPAGGPVSFLRGLLFSAGVSLLLIVIIAGGLLLIQYYFSDKMVLASMGAHEVSPAQAPELHAMIGRLAQQMDLPMPKVAIMQTDM